MYNIQPKNLFIGKSIVYLPTCHSTNEVAMGLLHKPGIFEGTVVITSNQTAGKGQRGNSWESEPFKNLTLSLILNPQFINVTHQFSLNIAISLAVCDFLTFFLGEKVKIKWPNDLYYQDESISKKLCGILIQNTVKKDHLDCSVVGIGININQQNFGEAKAISLGNITGENYNLEELLPVLMEKIEARYLQLKAGHEERLKLEYLQSLYWFNEERKYSTQKGVIQGKITGLDEIGRLKVVSSEGEVLTFSFKEIEFIE